MVLIVGKTPPPIGGVTIHVSRLLENLKKKGFTFRYFNLNDEQIIRLFPLMLNKKIKLVHLHTSNVYLQTIISLFCYFFSLKLFVTFHGNLGRYGLLKNMLQIFVVKIAKKGNNCLQIDI
jgi:glycosyltransferase involved in cell wall biosynthesis